MAAAVARTTRDLVFRRGKAMLEATQHTDFVLAAKQISIPPSERGGEVEQELCKQMFEFAHAQEMRVLPSSCDSMADYLSDPENAQDRAISLREVCVRELCL